MDITKKLQKIINEFDKKTINIVDGLTFSHAETIKRIEYISNSKYLSGDNDETGKKKPFYNISNYRVNIATRATDIDTKDIQIIADEPQFMPLSFILQKEVYNWMKDSNFAKTLNDMGYNRAKYGGVLLKKCEYEDEEEGEVMEIEIVDWRNVIVNPSNIGEIIIEKHFMDAEQLSEKMEVWDGVEDAMRMADKSPDGIVEVYEMHGSFQESLSPDGGDEFKYVRQCFFILKGAKDKMSVMYHYFEDSNPYKYLAWEEVSGRGLGRGVVEDGFEAQQWTNDAVVREKQVMELGSKLIFKTTDEKIQNNVLTDVMNGEIIKLSQGSDLSVVNTISGSLPEFRNLVQSWDTQYERVSSTFGAISGETMPGNTPYRTTAILNQEASSLFDYRREEAGIFLVEVFTDWVIPHLLKNFNKQHILSAEFSVEELKAIDDSYANHMANEEVNKLLDSGKPVYKEDYEQLKSGYKEMVQQSKGRRFLDIPKGMYKGWSPKVTIITTGEQKNKAAVLESLNNILMTAAKAPQVLTDPILSKVFSKILEVSGSGISPLSLAVDTQQSVGANTTQPTQPTAPEGAVPTNPIS